MIVLPALALAAPPSSVTRLQVDFDETDVIVSWDKNKEQDIAYYRVYYSADSILGNEGMYDDFDQTDGPKGQYVFQDLPPGSTLYVAVLAVNNEGEESLSFAEEVSITVPTGGGTSGNTEFDLSLFDDIVTSSDVRVTQEPEAPIEVAPSFEALDSAIEESLAEKNKVNEYGNVLHLLGGKAESPTRISLTFSHEITIDPQDAPKAFVIEKPGGGELQIKQLIIDEMDVFLETEQQERGVVYEVKVSEPLTGSESERLDTTDRQTLVMGHPEGKEPPPPEAAENQTEKGTIEKPETVTGLRLKAALAEEGLYTVDVRWNAKDVTGGLAHYVLSQSLDEGKTFAEPQILPGGMAGAELKGVYPGHFGIKIEAVNMAGNTSDAVFETIDLAATPEHPLPEDPVTPDRAPPEEAPYEETPVDNAPPTEPMPDPVEVPAPEADGPVDGSTLTANLLNEEVIESPAENLPQAGAGFTLFTLMFSGAAVGWKQSRYKLRFFA